MGKNTYPNSTRRKCPRLKANDNPTPSERNRVSQDVVDYCLTCPLKVCWEDIAYKKRTKELYDVYYNVEKEIQRINEIGQG